MPKVLLVEPDDELRRVFRRRFVREGFDLLEAADGEAVLGAVHDSVPDVIVVESSVFGGSGMDLRALLASEPALRSVPVIVLAARAPRRPPEERCHGSEDAGPPALLPDVAARPANEGLPGRRQELLHPFRPGRLVELARGALDGEHGRGATGAFG